MKAYFFLFLNFIATPVFLQDVFLNPDQQQRQLLNRQEILSGKLFENQLQLYPLNQKRTIASLIKLKQEDTNMDSIGLKRLLRDQVDALYLRNDSTAVILRNTFKRKAILKYFYKDGSHLLSIYKKDFQIQLDPLLHLEIGKENKNADLLFINRRGFRIQGVLDRRIYFNSEIIESQWATPRWVEDYISLYKSFPGAGFYKKNASSLFNNKLAYDFLLAEASVSVKASKHISVSLGHGKHFLGSGVRSLLLSDFAAPYFYFKINTNIWKLHYQNIFAELSPESLANEANHLVPKKYSASHYLGINLTKNWNVGLFESIVFSRKNGFEFQYLNPIILYRFVEHSLGSPDNVFLGFQSNIILKKRLSVYGQLLFDEFIFKELIKQNGWWGNKYGIQAGIKYINALNIKNLDLQLEFNLIRPYTYSFRDSFANYSHYNQAIAHPLGANFKELILKTNYRLLSKCYITAQCILYTKGVDSLTSNFGGNILLDYTTRTNDYNNSLGQGLQNTVLQLGCHFSYELLPRTWLDFNLNYRNNKLENENTATFWFGGGFRMTIDRMGFDF